MHPNAAYLTLIFLLTLVLVSVSGCSRGEEAKTGSSPPAVSAREEGKALFKKKCGVCHGLDRATAQTETREGWAAVIKEMQGKRTDWISEEDAAKILEYLASRYGE